MTRVFMNVGFFHIVFIVGLFYLVLSFHNYLILLLGVEYFILLVYIFFCLKVTILLNLVEFLFIFVTIIVLEGIMGLCLLIKNYRFMGGNIYTRW